MRMPVLLPLVLVAAAATAVPFADDLLPGGWTVHDPARPFPTSVTPGARPGAAPSDAIVLFGGDDASAWTSGGEACKWTVAGGELHVKPGTGDIRTREAFGDCQLHLEWMVAPEAHADGQHGANSGIFLMDRYEIQILQAHGNSTYADGTAGALYGQYPPLVNPCRPQGEWNTYDIVFRAPRFAADGSLVAPAHATVLFNGVVVQDATELLGGTAHKSMASYGAHAAELPMRLQDHGDPIRFRNIWVRRLAPRPTKTAG